MRDGVWVGSVVGIGDSLMTSAAPPPLCCMREGYWTGLWWLEVFFIGNQGAARGRGRAWACLSRKSGSIPDARSS